MVLVRQKYKHKNNDSEEAHTTQVYRQAEARQIFFFICACAYVKWESTSESVTSTSPPSCFSVSRTKEVWNSKHGNYTFCACLRACVYVVVKTRSYIAFTAVTQWTLLTTGKSFMIWKPSPGPICEIWLKLVGAEISLERISASMSARPPSLTLNPNR